MFSLVQKKNATSLASFLFREKHRKTRCITRKTRCIMVYLDQKSPEKSALPCLHGSPLWLGRPNIEEEEPVLLRGQKLRVDHHVLGILRGPWSNLCWPLKATWERKNGKIPKRHHHNISIYIHNISIYIMMIRILIIPLFHVDSCWLMLILSKLCYLHTKGAATLWWNCAGGRTLHSRSGNASRNSLW